MSGPWGPSECSVAMRRGFEPCSVKPRDPRPTWPSPREGPAVGKRPPQGALRRGVDLGPCVTILPLRALRWGAMPFRTRAGGGMAGANAVRAAKRKYKGQSGIAGGMPGSRIPAKRTKKRDLLSASAENPPEVDIPDTASPGSTGGKAKRTRKSPVAEEVKVDDALREKGKKIAEQLAALYPQPPIPLVHGNTFQLLVTVMLSAQTTDKKVNEVSPALFKLAPTPKAMATLDVDTIRTLIRQIGLAPTKSKNLSNMSKMLEEEHGGEVPNTFEALEKLPGVGHKTASVVMVQGFGQPAFPVDTHIHRLAARWGLSSGRNVKQTEEDLKNIFEEAMWRDLHLQIIYFGREYCPAQNHDASQCPICSWASVDSSRSSRKAARPKKGTPKKTIKKSSKRE